MLKLVAFVVLALSADQILAEKLNCEGKVGTFLVKGCNKYYTMCSSNGAFLYECPSGLKFDYRRRLCDYTENLPECKNEKKYRNHVFEALPMLKCDGREPDVNFVHPKFPCDNYYYSCSPGAQEPVRQTCPYNQYFDEDSNSCDFIERVKICKKTLNKEGRKTQHRKNQKINGYVEYNDPAAVVGENEEQPASDALIGSPAPPPSTTVTPSNLFSVEITSGNAAGAPNCLKVETGVYRDSEEKCSEKFWKCSNKKLFLYKCQKGLFYDAEVDRCDHKTLIPDCGGIRQATTPTPAADSVVVDFDCTNKEDNFYVKEACPTKFYHCNGGFAREIPCPDGLVYDTRINACDFPLACKEERPVAAAPSLFDHGSVKEQPKKEEKIMFDCSAKDDGLYEEKKCAQKYIQCVSGQPHRMSCAGGLVYNKQSGNCDYLENCSATTTTTTTAAPVADEPKEPEAPTHPYAPPKAKQIKPMKKVAPKKVIEYSTTTTTTTTTTAPATDSYSPPKQAAAVEKPTLVGISCTNLADGPTALELCSADYVECWQGVGTAQKCPGDLIFNTYTGQCDYHDHVPGCGPEQPAATTVEITTPAPTKKPTEKPDHFCRNLPDGTHGSGCKSIFYQCLSGVTHKMYCSSGLFYDVDEKHCNYKEEIVACGAKPKTTTTTTTTVSTPVAEAETFTSPYEVPSVAPAASEPEPEPVTTRAPKVIKLRTPIFDCVGKKDGLYALPTCTDVFIQCHNEKTHERECQAGLFYNNANGMCDYKENVPICGGSLPTVAPVPPVEEAPIAQSEPVDSAPAYSAPSPSMYKAPAQSQAPTKVKPSRFAPAMSCNGKSDGYFSAGCSPEYFSCVNGAMQKLGCAPSLRFSESTGRCDFAELVAECGGSAPVTSAPASTAAPIPVEISEAQPQGPYQPITKPAPVPTADSCVGKADGQYSHGCSSNYFSCSNEVALKLSCPQNLRFAQSLRSCEYPPHVEECGGQAPVPQTIPTASPAVTVPPKALEQKSQKPSFTCIGKSDGFYSNGCASTYASCMGGRTGILKCPNSLKFSATEGRCDFKEHVPECGGSPPTPAPAAAQPIAPAASIHSCVGKVDGYYTVGCSEEYFSCVSGLATTFNCPAHLRFNEATMFCDYPLAVPACGGSSSTAAPVTPRPVQKSEPKFDCGKKSDGYYAVAPCSPYYASCAVGFATIGRCPAPLKYNSLNGNCEFEHLIPACQIVPSVPVNPSPTPAQAPQQAEFSCVGRALGNYAISECSQEFVQCTPYTIVKSKCSLGLVFNPANGYCDTTKNVVGCVAAQVPDVAVPAPESVFTCAQRVDGHYSAARCSSNYYRCAQGVSYRYTCGTGLIFDQALGSCNYPINVGGC